MGGRANRWARGVVRAVGLSSLVLLAAACDDDDSNRATPAGATPVQTYTVGGSVSGLAGTLTLLNNGGDARMVTANGPFTFATRLAANANYAVTVQTQPENQQCTVSNGSGAATGNVTSVVIACETVRTTATIGAAGGTLIGPDGVEVEIPPLALSEDTVIGIARSSAGAPPPPSSNMQLGPIYEFTPHDITFREPVTIRMPVPAGAIDPTAVMAGVGEDFGVVDAQMTNGIAEISRITFSWGAIIGACFAPGPGDDPYGCVAPRGGSSFTSTPTAALSFVNQSSSSRNYNLSDAATLHVRINYKAQADCVNTSSVRVRRAPIQSNGAIQPPLQTVVEQGAAMTPDAPGSGCIGCAQTGTPTQIYTASGVTTLNAPLTHADNGRWFYSMQFSCTRRGVTRTYADAATINVDIAAPTVTYSIGGSVSGLTGSGLVLQNNGADDLAISANGAFTFATEIGAGAPYNISVRTQPSNQVCTVQNASGTAQSHVTNVQVACAIASAKSWQGAELIEQLNPGHAEAPRVGFDSAGNATAVWFHTTRDPVTYVLNTDVWANRYTRAGGWGSPVRVAQVGDGGVEDLDVAVQANGDAVAVWVQDDAQGESIYASRYVMGSGWSAAAPVESRSERARSLDISFDSSGVGFAIWLQNTGPSGTEDVWAARYVPGAGWSAPVLLEDRDDGAGDPRIAISANGEAIAVWGQNEEDSYVRSARYSGGGWGPASAIAATFGYPSDDLALAIDDAGQAVLAYIESGFSGGVYAVRFTGGAWGARDTIRTAVYPGRLVLAVDGGGEAMIMWIEGEGAEQVWARPYGAWSGAAVNIGDNAVGNVRVDLSFDVDGAVMAAQTHNVGDRILVSRYTHGAGAPWSAPVTAGQGSAPAYNPDLAIDQEGNAIVVWEQYGGSSQTDIAATVYR